LLLSVTKIILYGIIFLLSIAKTTIVCIYVCWCLSLKLCSIFVVFVFCKLLMYLQKLWSFVVKLFLCCEKYCLSYKIVVLFPVLKCVCIFCFCYLYVKIYFFLSFNSDVYKWVYANDVKIIFTRIYDLV